MSIGSTIAAVAGLIGVMNLFGIANTVGFHRLLTHRSFKTRNWLRYTLALLSAQYSGSPMMWVGVHRVHHTISDGKGDPHSPRHNGFWYAHSGWLIGTKNPVLSIAFALSGFGLHLRFLYWDVLRVIGKRKPVWRKMTRDLQKERFFRFLDAPFVIPAMFAAQVAAAWFIAGWWGIGWLWAFHLLQNNNTWLVNSVCHMPWAGTKPHETRDDSRNVGWLGFLTFGEAYHNGHHKYPKSARHGLLAGEMDISWGVIRLLSKLGLAWDIQIPAKFRAPAADAAPAPSK